MGRKHVFTKSQEKFIKANYLKLSSRRLAEKVNCDRGVVQRFLKKNGLTVPADRIEELRKEGINRLRSRTTFTKKQDQFILENYLMVPVRAISKKIGKSPCGIYTRMRQLGLVVPIEIIEQRKRESRFKKGVISPNKGKKQEEFMSHEAIEKLKKTQFKKGHVPHNYVNGEFMATNGYITLSLGEGQQVLKHLHLWQEINGPLPKGYCLACIDGVRTNTDPSNWELITREELMLRNSKVELPPKSIRTMALASKLKKKIAKIKN